MNYFFVILPKFLVSAMLSLVIVDHHSSVSIQSRLPCRGLYFEYRLVGAEKLLSSFLLFLTTPCVPSIKHGQLVFDR